MMPRQQEAPAMRREAKCWRRQAGAKVCEEEGGGVKWRDGR